MTGRLARLLPADLDARQREVYDSVAGGERATGVQHFPLTGDDGSLHGPFGIMLHAPGVGAALSQLGSTIRFHTDLSARVREISILQVAHATGSAFEWWAHARVARAVGLSDHELMLLSLGSFTSDDPVEAAAARLCEVLLTSSTVDDDEYAAVAAVLTPEQIIDITTLVGYYRTLAQLMSVFDVGVPADD